ncbi:MAG: hypothetical protein OEY14_11290, partial [Myxococcales bacterium]|nr:hypothetical protein [Myxococcales bacterium]
SGADVAASVLGGFVRFRRDGAQLEADRLPAPPGLEMRIVWTGKEARTSAFVARVGALAARDRSTHRRLLGELAELSTRFCEAFERGEGASIVEAAARYHDAMRALGLAAGAPIVDESLTAIAALARSSGGAAKPSGAGGGDVAVAFFASSADAQRFDAACASRGLARIDMELGVEGVTELDSAGASEAPGR